MSNEQYDQLWTESWGDVQQAGPVHRRQREELLRLIRSLKVRTVLDVGCGAGDNLASLAQAMPELDLYGIDVSAQALAIAGRRVPSAKLQELDIQSQRLKESFDLVLCNQVIEHLADDQSALCNIARMTRAWLIVATMRGRMRRSEALIGHFRNYSDSELRRKANNAGLEVVDIFGWGFPFYSPLYRTAIEWLPGGPPKGEFGPNQRRVANLLYYLYGLNIPRRGDVVTMLARPSDA